MTLYNRSYTDLEASQAFTMRFDDTRRELSHDSAHDVITSLKIALSLNVVVTLAIVTFIFNLIAR